MASEMVLRPQSFDQLMIFANMAAKSSLVPRDYAGKPENIMLAVQMGSELGLAPMQALQNIAVINGRPAVWGDAMLALCKSHPLWGGALERIEGEGDNAAAACEVHRKGDNPVIARFSVEDAKRAGLWGKAGPWQSYPKRMLQMRARGFALRDAFPDALRGLISAEEAADTPTNNTFIGTTIDATPEPASPAPKATPEDRALELLAEIANCADSETLQAMHDRVGRAVQYLNANRLGDLADTIAAAYVDQQKALQGDGA